MLTIGQVASRAGLRASAIRFYESQGLLPTACRKGGRRIYDSSILERLAIIELAKTAGFQLEDIRVVLSASFQERALIWRTLSAAKRADLDQQIEKLTKMKEVLARLAECTCITPEQCERTIAAARLQH